MAWDPTESDPPSPASLQAPVMSGLHPNLIFSSKFRHA